MRHKALLASRSPPRCSRCRSVRPEETGIGAAPQSRAKERSERSRPGVVSGGDQQLPGGVDADAGQGDQMWGSCGDERGELGVEVIDLGLQCLPAAGQRTQRGLSCRGRVGQWARS